MSLSPPTDDTVLRRLTSVDEDQEDVVRKRYSKWTEFQPKIEEAFKQTVLQVNAEKPIKEIT